jgi:uncharacterized protein
MTPQERQLVDDLFERLAKLESAPRDPNASAAIADGLRRAPNAVYALVQTVLLQDEALKRANSHIQELEQALEQGQPPAQGQSGGFLDSMRDAVFGQSRGSVPNVPPPAPGRPVWNSGQVLQQSQPPGQGQYGQGQYGQSPYGQPPYGAPLAPQAPPFGGGAGGGGGSFLGTAAAAAAGVVGGSLLLGSIRNMMGGSHQGFGDTTSIEERGSRPWGGDQSGGSLARDAGVNDIGRNDDNSRSGLIDQASNRDDNDNNHDDDYQDDQDDMDADSNDDFGGDNDSDYA